MGQIAISFAVAHKDFIIGAAVGYGFAHIRVVVAFAFSAADKIPAIHAFIVKYSDAEKKAIAEAADEAGKQIDKAVAEDAPK